ncbi:MAG: hypothetical protein ACI8W8_002429 [Rhodothermales bacterium]|jgi:hypothetical protein
MADIFSAGSTPPGPFRWVDAADQAYASAYRNTYDYSQATVSVDIPERATRFAGIIEATGLKPNFAYQLKLHGDPSRVSNEWIGYAGRWWQESWNGSSWGSGQNLNSKGNGSFPNPNDLVYQSRRDIANASSPTGKQYRFQGYLLVDYFITDENGDATVSFEANSYHVLWKTTQRGRASGDGPTVTGSFDPDPAQAAYDAEFAAKSVSIFGEWERLPATDVLLPDGEYGASLILTEESFHGSGGTYAGFWASAMSAWLEFRIGAGPELASFSATPTRGGLAQITPDRDVSVQLTASAGASGWWIGESEKEPGSGWLDDAPTSYTITGEPGPIALYARVRDDSGSISDPLSTQLTFEPAREFSVSLGGETLVLGQWSGATAQFDAGFDVDAELNAALWLGDGLAADYRSTGDGHWQLRVDQPGEISWSMDSIEPGEWLLLQALVDGVPSDAPQAMNPAGSFQVAAGDFILMLGYPESVDLSTKPGWRLFGCSVYTPLSTASAFPDVEVWRWAGGYEHCLGSDGLVPGHGYWTYSDGPIPALRGIVAPTAVSLIAGWNLVAVAESATLESPVIDAIWGWHGHFRRASILLPGQAYWVHASEDAIVAPGN